MICFGNSLVESNSKWVGWLTTGGFLQIRAPLTLDRIGLTSNCPWHKEEGMESADTHGDWSQLPSELLEKQIWKFLPFSSVVASGMVCSAWHAAMVNLYSISIDFARDNMSQVLKQDKFERFITQFPSLYAVTLNGTERLNFENISALSRSSGQTLSHLSLSCAANTVITTSHFPFKDWFPALRHLDLSGCAIPISACNETVFPTTLTSLILSSGLKVVDDSLFQLSKHLTNLTRFEARGAYRLSDKGVSHILSRNPNLTYLDLTSLQQLTDATIGFAQRSCPSMSTLIARGLLITDNALTDIAWPSTLTYLSLKMCPRITDEGICEKLIPNNLLQLRTLDLQKAPLASSSRILQSIASYCPYLTALDLRDCTAWNPQEGEWTEFLRTIPISILYLRSKLVLDRHIAEIAYNAPNLTLFYLQECTSLTPDGAVKDITDCVLSGRLRRLHRLTISDIPWNSEKVDSLTSRCPSVLVTHRKERNDTRQPPLQSKASRIPRTSQGPA